MDYQVVLSDAFIPDLKEIVNYLADRAGAATAFRIGNQLLERALETRCNPFIGQSIPKCPGARKVRQHSYLIYYDLNQDQRAVEVLRAWHGARDPKTLRLDF